MKRSLVTFIAWSLLVLPLAVGAAPHVGVKAASSAAACKGCTANARSSTSNNGSSVTYKSLTSEAIVNCATDKNCQLLRLRNMGLALKEKDGGNLTAEHRADLQAQLEAINARFK